jgi:membrane carboxypeptidase/penicillin-binding protein PbpC
VSVSGLGTERLIERPRPAACRDGNDSAWPAYGGWLPRAAVAVLDPRYFEHAGYAVDAWTSSRAHADPTLSQRAARLALGRADSTAAASLRETLFAVEMERTLGKARLLDFYLAQAPWGDGLCGVERAVRVHLGQRDPNTVGPVAAAWLASLLPAPDERLGAQMAAGQVDRERVAGVIRAMRPMREARREQALADLPSWAPAALPAVGPAPSASEVAEQTAAPTPPPIP